jgi:hypothetical protein
MAQTAWKYSRPNSSGNVATNAASGDVNAPSTGPSISSQTAQQNKPQTNAPNTINNPSSPSSPRAFNVNGPVSSNIDEAQKEDATTYYERVIKYIRMPSSSFSLMFIHFLISLISKSTQEVTFFICSFF